MMRPLGGPTVDHMERRENGAPDRWIVWKLPRTTPEQWVAGPREKGVMAELGPITRKWVLHDSLEEAADYARDRLQTLRNRAQLHAELLPAFHAQQIAANVTRRAADGAARRNAHLAQENPR